MDINTSIFWNQFANLITTQQSETVNHVPTSAKRHQSENGNNGSPTIVLPHQHAQQAMAIQDGRPGMRRDVPTLHPRTEFPMAARIRQGGANVPKPDTSPRPIMGIWKHRMA